MARYFEAAQSESLILFYPPSIQMAHTQFINTERKLRLAGLVLLDIPPTRLRVGSIQNSRIGCFAKPLNTLPLVGPHAPSMATGESV
ncbi:hypothetical protein ACKS0A_00742 [Histoplasma ohiense]